MNMSRQLCTSIILIIFSITIISCGDIKIKGDIEDDVLDKVGSFFDDDSGSSNPDDDTSNDEDEGEYEDEDDAHSDYLSEQECIDMLSSSTIDALDLMRFDEESFNECWESFFDKDNEFDNFSEEEGDYEGQLNAENSDDTTGGISFLEPINKDVVRYFIGTWEINEGGSSCTDKEGANLDLPIILRAYSYGIYMDFETSMSELVWSGIIYPDDTFDFEINFLDKYGKPSIDLVCTCAMYEHYWEDTLECTCDPSHRESSCSLIYEMF
ncbi:hypothetical protein KJ708_10400 [bacterium]|nr:hypothetical protein [bacterium]MBU1916685.1 hypothetical protein [bacterium]